MIYRRIKHVEDPHTKAGIPERPHYSQKADDSVVHNKGAESPKCLNNKRAERARRKRNELQQYRMIIGSFKRIRILSRRESIPRIQAPFRDEKSEQSVEPLVGLHSEHPAEAWKYYFPSDSDNDKVLEVQDMLHFVLERVCGKFIFAPVSDYLRESAVVIDIGNGSGIWAVDGISPISSISATYSRC